MIHLRTSIKFIILLAISAFLIISAVSFIYKPIYKVSLNGEFLGYSADKSKLQAKINDYIVSGDNQNIAFVQLDELPQYKLCLLKKGISTTDDEIYEAVIKTGVPYYHFYSLALNGEDKYFVSTFQEAESVVAKLKEKNSNNVDKLAISEKYETDLKEFTLIDDCVSKLYEEKIIEKKITKSIVTSKTDLGINFLNPVSGRITSRFGSRESIRTSAHRGLDIAAPNGTPIYASASGKVEFSGNRGNSYGNYVIISHGNGVKTYYAHCSKLLVSTGQYVSAGQLIAKVGSTGRSTGNHLHFEVNVNGVVKNPLNYVNY